MLRRTAHRVFPGQGLPHNRGSSSPHSPSVSATSRPAPRSAVSVDAANAPSRIRSFSCSESVRTGRKPVVRHFGELSSTPFPGESSFSDRFQGAHMTITLRPGSTVVFTGDLIIDCQRLKSEGAGSPVRPCVVPEPGSGRRRCGRCSRGAKHQARAISARLFPSTAGTPVRPAVDGRRRPASGTRRPSPSAPYVAITRATRRLTVTHRGDLPGMLARLRRH